MATGKATFYGGGRRAYKQLRRGPHPTQESEVIPTQEPTIAIEDALADIQLAGGDVHPEYRERAREMRDQLTLIASAWQSLSHPPRMPSRADIVATLEEFENLCRDDSKEPVVRAILRDGKCDAATETLLAEAAFRRSRLAGRAMVPGELHKLSLSELRQVARDARIDLPGANVGRPTQDDPTAQFVGMTIGVILKIDPDARDYFVDHPAGEHNPLYDLLDATLQCEGGRLDELYDFVLAMHPELLDVKETARLPADSGDLSVG